MLSLYYNAVFSLVAAKERAKNTLKDFVSGESGEVNIIVVIILLAIALALAIVFRKQLKTLFDNIWKSITDSTDELIDQY